MDKRSLLFIICVTTAFMGIKSWYADKHEQELKAWKETHERSSSPPPEASMEAPSNDEIPAEETPASEQHFFLETPYQQIVFSSKGGAITEINLPFKGPNYPKSVVLPIEIDRKLKEEHPNKDQFPLVDAKKADGSMVQPSVGGYYPLLRRSIGSPSCLAIVSAYPEFAALTFRVTDFTERSITFEARQPYRTIKKTFSLPKEPDRFPYCLDVEITIEGSRKDLWLSSGTPEVEWLAGSSGAALKYRIVRGASASVERISLPKTVFTNSTLRPDWTCNSNGFFGIILDPLQGEGPGFSFHRISGEEALSRLLLFNEARQRYSAEDLPGYETRIPFSPNQKTMRLRLFAGPFADSVLTTIDANSLEDHAKPTNYLSCQTFHGWFSFVSEPFARFLFFIMKLLHKVFGSWALSIIFATVVLRVLLYPLNRWSLRSMKAMQEVAPIIKEIQERHKKDPTKAQMEIMALYREKKVNPFSGCLPLLIQMPFLIGMFDLLKSTFELRGASFIPGWIDDLSAPDVLFEWPFHIPFIGDEFHLLPIFLGATMWFQQYFSSTLPKNSAEWTDQQRQQRAMGNVMTVVMTVMFYHFPSGLNIYWISSMLLGIGQQLWTNRKKM